MADTKISDLPSVDPLDGTEELAIVQDSTSKKGAIDDIVTYIDSLGGSAAFNPIANQVFGG